MQRRFAVIVLALLATVTLWSGSPGVVESNASVPAAADPPGRDSILDWNAVAIEALRQDFSGTFGGPQQPGPTGSSRALAIVHAAMFDAANSVQPTYRPYLTSVSRTGASLDAAVATAAYTTLAALYSKQAHPLTLLYAAYLKGIRNSTALQRGVEVGLVVAARILKARKNDGSQIAGEYIPSGEPGTHDVDPENPGQGFLGPAWGNVTPFALDAGFHLEFVPPPAIDSEEYAEFFDDVKRFGGDGLNTDTDRSLEQTYIGLYWAYDGANGLGTPPRLYNQIVRTVAQQEGNTELENAKLFLLVNVAMADGGIICWKEKYLYAYWRPVLGIRRADEDDNDLTEAEAAWTPLGAPNSNQQNANNFTPPFPSYSSGHATFGAAVFTALQRFYETDDIGFTFVSEELNGQTTDNLGNPRPLVPLTFGSFSEANTSNARSRVYLGVHWMFDQIEGMRCGQIVSNYVCDRLAAPLP